MFKCDQCGDCCRSLYQSHLYAELDCGDGMCIYLEGNLCGIYEDRPLLCRVDECYTVFYQDLMSIEEYYRFNYESCKILKQMRR